jgi:hypothetical protein
MLGEGEGGWARMSGLVEVDAEHRQARQVAPARDDGLACELDRWLERINPA